MKRVTNTAGYPVVDEIVEGVAPRIPTCEGHNQPICSECGYCVMDVEHLKHVNRQPEREVEESQWTAKDYDSEFDGYPVLSPGGLAAIATDSEYQELIVTAVNNHVILTTALYDILADCQAAAEGNTAADWDFAVVHAIDYATAALARVHRE